jgi:SAM-dependent methyltransferase
MTTPRLREDQLGDLYSNYYPRKHVDVAALRLEAEKVLHPQARLKRWWNGTDNQGQYSVRPGEKILDVGSGSGLSLMEATALGGQAFGVEADPNVRRIAEELGMSVHIGSLHDNPFPGQSFDLIVLNQVIEHIPDPGAALERIRSRLAPGGRVMMVLPNRNSLWCRISGERWINWHIPYHLHHFTAKGFRLFAVRHGFRVVRSRTITPNIWTVLQLRAMREVPKRGTPSQIWAVKPAEVPAVQPQATPAEISPAVRKRPLRRMARIAVLSASAVFNRFVDMAGMGDSLLVELRIGNRP